MDIQAIITAISTVGFPIVACGAMFWKINKQDEEHRAEMDSIRSTLENNTVALTSLKQLIEDKLK